MRILVSEKLSPHKMKTPEGYLICTDAILSRTGKQTYRRSEIWGDACDNADEEVEVDRKAEEVFNDKTLASFENKPICIEHPDEDVNVSNHNQLSVGFVRDIKRGKVDGQDVMLGTLVITDADAIEAIERGDYTELSCGYNCDIIDEDHPQQRNIRGNHVALCEHGRAGIARIVDSIDDAGIKVWQVRQGYAIVVKRYWQQYGRNAFVDATESNIDDARYRRGSLERNDKMAFVIIDCNDGKYKIEDEGMKDIQATKTPGTDKIIYVMQSDVDKNLYFYIGKTFSMKEGTWGYSKFEMGSTTPEQLKAELSKNGWHAVSRGVARIIDIEHEVVTDEIMKDASRQTLIEKLRTISIPYGERYALTSGSGWHIDIQHHGQAAYENVNKYPHVSAKESSKATIRLWYNGKHMKTFEGPLNSAKSDAIRYLQTRTEDAWSSVEEENYNKANKVLTKDKQLIRSSSNEIHVFKARGKYEVDAYNRNNLDYNALRQIENKFNVNLHRGDYGYITIISANKDAIYKAFAAINPAYGVGSWRIEDSVVKDSKEQLFTIEYKQGDTTYIHKVRASSITDAVSKVKDDVSNIKDVYNKFEHETDKEYLKSSINEMSRYISNWSFMTTREKRNISPEGLGALKQMLKFAQQRLAELK